MNEKRTILIVDDEQHGRQILEKLLTSPDYTLAFAATGLEALTKAVQLIPDLILLDVMMPDMDGFEVCRRLRADSLLADVPLLLLTALNDRHSRLEGIKAGADDFVTKPFDHIELKARVETILRLDRYRRLLVERLKFERVVERAENGYLMIDENDKIFYANLRARLYLSLPAGKEEPLGNDFLDLIQKQYICEPYASWIVWPGLPNNASPRYLIRPESPTSNPFWLQVNVIDLPATTEETHRIVQLIDITQQMSLHQDMTGFHAMVSHKLRTPLIGMISSLEILATHSARLSSDEVSDIARTALGGVKRLRGQINDVLQYLQVSKEDEERPHVQLDQLEKMMTEFSANLEVNSVSIHIQEDIRQAQVRLSKQSMGLVLWEALENAKKFHPQQWPTVEINVLQINPYEVCLRVTDDGIHLSPEQLTQVWRPYYQGEKLFTGEIEGMGLGLSMAAVAVWGAGGTCHIYNREEKPGVVVEFILPLDRNSHPRQNGL